MVVVGTTGLMYFRQELSEIGSYLDRIERKYGMIRSLRPAVITFEDVNTVESEWVSFLKRKESLFRDILRSNVQAYFDLEYKMKSGHIGNH